jgi:deoxyribonuclease-4
MTTELLLGSHMSTAGGMAKAIERGESIGCTAIQVFVKGNTRWQFPPLKDDDIAAFRAGLERGNIKSVIAHAIYLVNLASDKQEFVRKSVDDLVDELTRCETLGIPGLVLLPVAHCGAGDDCGLAAIVAGLDEVFQATADFKVQILLETTAGQGSCLGWQFSELAHIINNVRKPERLGICLDTCHVFAAGYDIRTEAGYKQLWADFDSVIGRDNLKAIHLNDSKQPCGSRKDRHHHIGQGEIGLEAFKFIMNDKSLRGIPMVLETEKDKEMTEDVKNMKLLRSLLND